MSPNFKSSKGLDRPEIGLHAIGLDQISGVLLLIPASIYDCYVVLMISNALICSLNIYYIRNQCVFNIAWHNMYHMSA